MSCIITTPWGGQSCLRTRFPAGPTGREAGRCRPSVSLDSYWRSGQESGRRRMKQHQGPTNAFRLRRGARPRGRWQSLSDRHGPAGPAHSVLVPNPAGSLAEYDIARRILPVSGQGRAQGFYARTRFADRSCPTVMGRASGSAAAATISSSVIGAWASEETGVRCRPSALRPLCHQIEFSR